MGKNGMLEEPLYICSYFSMRARFMANLILFLLPPGVPLDAFQPKIYLQRKMVLDCILTER